MRIALGSWSSRPSRRRSKVASRQDNRSAPTVDMKMPDDGTEVENAEQSPLDVEPARRKQAKNAPRRRVKEYDEAVPHEQEIGESQFEDDSPLNGDAEAALA